MKNHLKRFWGLYCSGIFFIVLVCGGCISLLVWNFQVRDASGGQTIPPSGGVSTSSEAVLVDNTSQAENGNANMTIRLSEGQAHPQAVAPLPVVTGEPLTEEEIQQILSRLPDIETETTDQAEFRLPEEVLPPPQPGETVSETFPPPPENAVPPEEETGPLEVLRYGPEGEVPIAPFISVTFNQFMVPLTTLEDLTEEEVPVQIEPDLPGTWRWVGTKTLTFNYDSDVIDRLPMATEYRVTIPAGTQSASGGVLAETVEFTFRTPAPQVVNTYPYGESQPLDPLFFVAFDQRVDPQAVLDTISAMAGGSLLTLKLATEDEIAADKTVSQLAENTLEARWLVFKATESLPKDANISVNIGPGTPSAEGPLVMQSGYNYSFRTYAPLQIIDHGCSWWDEDCPPLTPFFIEFNNSIDASVYTADMLRVEPEIPGVMVDIFGNSIQIRGETQGSTTYSVFVSDEIQDIFGQTLGSAENLTFKVGPAEPMLIGPDSVFVTIDPAAEDPALSLYTINYSKLDVQIFAVQPADWPAFKTYLQQYQQTDQHPEPPGQKVFDGSLPIEAPADKLTEVYIDLSQYLEGDYGHFIVIAKPPKRFFQEDRYWETIQTWVQITQIGLDAFVDHSEMVVWANALQDGAPLSDVRITSDADVPQILTGDDGTARFAIPSAGVSYLVASLGADQALLPRSTYYWGDESWAKYSLSDTLSWYVFDDRQMYRPGEEVHIKGWLRLIGGKQNGDVVLPGSALSGVSYNILDPQGNNLGTGRVDVNALGGFDFNFTLPETTNLGYAYIEMRAESSLSADGWNYSHNFQIQEFRRPEFEVIARNETTGPYFADGSATVAVEAAYYAGGPLPNAEVSWMVNSSPTNYNPPNWPDFTFGIWQPWWYYYGPYIEGDIYVSGGETQFFEGNTDATGNHYLNLDFGQPAEPRPQSVLAEATVMDVNRQAWSGSTSLLVHPADIYVGLRSDKYFVEKGTPLKIELILVDLDGNPVQDRPIQVTTARLDWKFENGSWFEVESDAQECTVGSQAEPVTCTFETPVGGKYLITARVTDEIGRQNLSQFTRWVSGGELPPARKVEQETATLIPDQETYQPGDVAKILVQSPFNPAEGLLTISRSGFLYTERFQITDGSITLEIPIEEIHIPNLNLQVDLVGESPRVDDLGNPLPDVAPRPAYARGNLNLTIPPLLRTLALEVTPRDAALEPGGETTVFVALKDPEGRPVPGAELAVVVVDEAILALTSYQLADPISVFYSDRPSYVESYYSRASIVLIDPQILANAIVERQEVVEKEVMSEEIAGEAAPMEEPIAAMPTADQAEGLPNAGGGNEAASTPITVRLDFNPLATFIPEARTDANGEARVEVKLPDNLTRYRIMVVAVDASGKLFGSAESNLTARLPLMVRPSAPRFLNFGDNFELPVVLQNQTNEPMTVEVVAETTNLSLTAGQGRRVIIPANDRIEVRFPAAADMAGTARLQIAAVSDVAGGGAYADAAQVSLPVYTPATTEAFAVYGVVDEGAIAQPVATPSEVFSQIGGLEIQTSSTALQALTDAVLYLVSYPFECSEQLASRILGVAALRDVLTAFEAEGLPSPEEMEAAVNRDIKRLQGMQNGDGGFPYWRRGQESIPFNSIHVAHALQRAEQKGFVVPQSLQEQVLYYLQSIESYFPSWYDESTRNFLSSYALYVRNLMGDRDAEKARNLLNSVGLENLQMEAIGWLWQVLLDDPNSLAEVEAIRQYVNNRVVETPGAANFTTYYDEQSYLLLQSDRRTDAIMLDAMIADDPDSDLIPKLVNGLLAHRTNGRWGNTQENVFVLLALDRYFNTFEAQTPDFVARIWLGETFAGEHVYEGYTTERHETQIPMVYLVDPALGGGETQDLILSKDGTGRMYYRLGLSYAPTDLWLDPLDMGFVVQRVYEAVDDPADVTRDEGGVWHIKAGVRVRIRLTMIADNRRYHVALVDPLPAGLEIINPSLAVSGSIPQDPDSSDYKYGWWWWGVWYDHQNMRDERAEAFTPLLWEGVYAYTYVARATIPGKFVVPPAKAEEMYSPEVFGRSASDWVIVE